MDKKSYYQLNKEAFKARAVARWKNIPLEERRRMGREYARRWRLKNPVKNRAINLASRKKNYHRYKANHQYRIKHKLSKACCVYAGHYPGRGGGVWFMDAVLGISRLEFSKLCPKTKGMTFDHITPFKAFDLTNPEHVVRCAFHKNIRFTTQKANFEKGHKFPDNLDVMSLPWIGTEEALEAARKLIVKNPAPKRKELDWSI